MLTDATLTKAQARKVAAVAHDGLARAITPVHSMSDGAFNALLEAAADVFAAACLDALTSAEGRGPWRSYTELAPSAARGEIPGPR